MFHIHRVLYQYGRTQVLLVQHDHKYGKQKVVLKKTDLTGQSTNGRQLALQEAHLLRKLKHPNIVRCLDTYEEQNHVCIVMEWAELGDLSASWPKFDDHRVLVECAMDVLIQLLLSLRYLHDQNVIHRDVKTKNILAGRLLPSYSGFRVKLGDFGVARVLPSASSMAQTVIGTPFYSSPEIFSGEEYDTRSDIWSLGCVIYELVSGFRPFQSSEFRDLSRKVRHCSYSPLPKDLPYGLRDIIDSMLQPNISLRPSAAQILVHPFVRQHCNRLYTLLQTPAYPEEFNRAYSELKNRLGPRQAAETFVLLMAPNMMEQAKNTPEADLIKVAHKAWALKNSKREATTDSLDEFTMTIKNL